MTAENRSLWEEVAQCSGPFMGPLATAASFRDPSSGCWMSMSAAALPFLETFDDFWLTSYDFWLTYDVFLLLMIYLSSMLYL